MKIVALVFSRLYKALFVVLGVVILNFLLIHLAPGDPASVIAGESGVADPAYVQALRHEFQLDQPLYVQLWTYLDGVLHLNLGYSYRNRLSVLQLILERLPATLLLMGCAFVLSVLLGVAVGVLAARCRYSGRFRWLDSVLMGVALAFYATPSFWLALLAIILFSVVLGWLPAFGMESVGLMLTGWPYVLDVARHLILPTLSLALFFMAVYARLARASMLEVMDMDFVRTARAKGASTRRVIFRHVLRNALLPVITFGGLQLGQMVGGAILTETVFAWPGIGRLMFDALMQRDYQVLLGVFLITSIVVVAFNLITDLAYHFADPRVSTRN